MSKNRRNFIKKTAFGTLGIGAILSCDSKTEKEENTREKTIKKEFRRPLIISTWNHGLPANEEAWKQLKTENQV